jgi:hypothetical protein
MAGHIRSVQIKIANPRESRTFYEAVLGASGFGIVPSFVIDPNGHNLEAVFQAAES